LSIQRSNKGKPKQAALPAKPAFSFLKKSVMIRALEVHNFLNIAKDFQKKFNNDARSRGKSWIYANIPQNIVL